MPTTLFSLVVDELGFLIIDVSLLDVSTGNCLIAGWGNNIFVYSSYKLFD